MVSTSRRDRLNDRAGVLQRTRGYWGRNFFKYNSDFVGILTLALAALALVRKRDATRIFYASTALVLLAYSLGPHTPIHRLFYALVPQVKLFRAPPLVMFLVAFSLVTLAALAVHDWPSEHPATKAKDRGPRAFPALHPFVLLSQV